MKQENVTAFAPFEIVQQDQKQCKCYPALGGKSLPIVEDSWLCDSVQRADFILSIRSYPVRRNSSPISESKHAGQGCSTLSQCRQNHGPALPNFHQCFQQKLSSCANSKTFGDLNTWNEIHYSSLIRISIHLKFCFATWKFQAQNRVEQNAK